MNLPREIELEQRDDLVERVAREIQLRGLTTPAVHFLQASRPYRSLGANAMLFFDPVLRGVFGGDLPPRQRAHGRRRRHRAAHRPARGARRRDHLGRLTRHAIRRRSRRRRSAARGSERRASVLAGSDRAARLSSPTRPAARRATNRSRLRGTSDGRWRLPAARHSSPSTAGPRRRSAALIGRDRRSLAAPRLGRAARRACDVDCPDRARRRRVWRPRTRISPVDLPSTSPLSSPRLVARTAAARRRSPSSPRPNGAATSSKRAASGRRLADRVRQSRAARRARADRPCTRPRGRGALLVGAGAPASPDEKRALQLLGPLVAAVAARRPELADRPRRRRDAARSAADPGARGGSAGRAAASLLPDGGGAGSERGDALRDALEDLRADADGQPARHSSAPTRRLAEVLGRRVEAVEIGHSGGARVAAGRWLGRDDEPVPRAAIVAAAGPDARGARRRRCSTASSAGRASRSTGRACAIGCASCGWRRGPRRTARARCCG